jgi:pimeloyl-ACP methyl ester carboxylesterase
MLATDYPERVASVTLIAAGGIVPALTEPGELGILLSNRNLTFDEKMQLARRTLFSAATADALVEDYVESLRYWPDARAAQGQANRNTPLEEWVAGGEGPLLMVMGEDDLTAPIENGHIMKAEHGDRLKLVIVPGAGHVVGLEKPADTAAAIVEFLKNHPL